MCRKPGNGREKCFPINGRCGRLCRRRCRSGWKSSTPSACSPHDELLRKRRSEIATLRRDLKKLRDDIADLWRLCEPRARSYVIKYSPDQPRVPAANPDGRRWARDLQTTLRTASPDDPEHPGWPAGTADGRGGKFRPKDSDGSAAGAIATETRRRRIALTIEEKCEAQYEKDLEECGLVGSPACYAQAMLRYANCLRGLPIPPLNY